MTNSDNDNDIHWQSVLKINFWSIWSLNSLQHVENEWSSVLHLWILRCYLKFCRQGKPVPHILHTFKSSVLFTVQCILFVHFIEPYSSPYYLKSFVSVLWLPSLEMLWDCHSQKIKNHIIVGWQYNVVWYKSCVSVLIREMTQIFTMFWLAVYFLWILLLFICIQCVNCL